MSNSGKIHESKQDKRVIVWACILTIGWLGALGGLLWSLPGKCIPGSHGYIDKFFGCITLNEVGDFLAGAFSPLAFLWLVVAVIVQSKELAAQREELGLTRDEMREQRMVLTSQATEARKQAEFFGRQTEVLEYEDRERTQRANDERYKGRLQRLYEFAKTWTIADSSEYREPENALIRLRVSGRDLTPMDNHLPSSGENILGAVRLMTMDLIHDQMKVNFLHADNASQFQLMADRLSDMVAGFDELTPALSDSVQATDLPPIIEAFQLMAEKSHEITTEEARQITTQFSGPRELPVLLRPGDFELTVLLFGN